MDNLIWEENFLDSTINSKIWSFEEGYVRNNEEQFYTNQKKNCRIENDQLILEAHKEKYRGYNYTSASITTKDKVEFLYGKLVIKAQLPKGRGKYNREMVLSGT